MRIKHISLAIILATVLIVSLVACTGPSANNNSKTIADLLAHFSASGLAVGQQSTKHFAMLGASDGLGVEISGKNVEIYKYDTNDTAQRKIIEKITKEEVHSFMGFVFPAKANGSFVLIHYTDHPQKDLLLKTFMSFK